MCRYGLRGFLGASAAASTVSVAIGKTSGTLCLPPLAGDGDVRVMVTMAVHDGKAQSRAFALFLW